MQGIAEYRQAWGRVNYALRAWGRSPSTKLALCVGATMYAAYGWAHDAWSSPALVGTSLFVALALPRYSRLSNKAEQKANDLTAHVTAGRLARFALQAAFNLAAFAVMAFGATLKPDGIAAVGGIVGAALLTTAASQGAQYVAIWAFQRGLGDLNRNVLIGLSANVVITAIGTAGVPVIREIFVIGALALGALVFGIGLLSDLRAHFYPKGGIAIYFGTFNPFHNTHLALIRRAIENRGVDKVIVHPTIMPRFHVRAFDKGEIRVGRIENGYQILETTDKADVNVDYFPTGRKFLAPEIRRDLIGLAIEEAGLAGKVEAAFWPDTYAERGFQGVIARIKAAYPGKAIHGIHGSDWGGMTVRGIMDECGWIYPMPTLRRDAVSATAIRAGAQGMTSLAVAQALDRLARGLPAVIANDLEAERNKQDAREVLHAATR